MDLDLKKQLRTKLEAIAPEYGMVEWSYPSFMRSYGFRSHPLSAADAVEAVSALLDVAGGVRMEIEVEGARNGGEWFGGGKVWELHNKPKKENRENTSPDDGGTRGVGDEGRVDDEQDGETGKGREADWWVKNFWSAFDALIK
jgi:cell division control protein 45